MYTISIAIVNDFLENSHNKLEYCEISPHILIKEPSINLMRTDFIVKAININNLSSAKISFSNLFKADLNKFKIIHRRKDRNGQP